MLNSRSRESCAEVDLVRIHLPNEAPLFGLKVEGEGLAEKHISKGDILVVDPRREPRIGDVVIVRLEGKSLVRIYSMDGGSPALRSGSMARMERSLPMGSALMQGVVSFVLSSR